MKFYMDIMEKIMKLWNLIDVRSRIPYVRLSVNFAYGTESKTIKGEFIFYFVA